MYTNAIIITYRRRDSDVYYSYAKGDNTRSCTEKMSAYVRNVYIKKIIILFVLKVKYLVRGRRRVVQYNNIISIYGRYLSPPPCDTISRADGPVGKKKILSY